MKLKEDKHADALYFALSDALGNRIVEVSHGIFLDYDEEDRVVGIEILCLSKQATALDLQRLLFETVPYEGYHFKK